VAGIAVITFCEVNQYIGDGVAAYDVSDKVVKYFHSSEADQRTPEVAAAAGARSSGPAQSRVASVAKMVLSVYAMSYSDIESALHRVEQLCKEAEKTQSVRHDDISKLSADQVM